MKLDEMDGVSLDNNSLDISDFDRILDVKRMERERIIAQKRERERIIAQKKEALEAA